MKLCHLTVHYQRQAKYDPLRPKLRGKKDTQQAPESTTEVVITNVLSSTGTVDNTRLAKEKDENAAKFFNPLSHNNKWLTYTCLTFLKI